MVGVSPDQAGAMGMEDLFELLTEEVAVVANKSNSSVSLKITVPSKFARYLGIEPGSRVLVTLDPARRKLIVAPKDGP